MTAKSMLFEIVLIIIGIVGLYESWNYLNSANLENYSQTDLIGFPLLMIACTMFAIGFMYLLADVAQLFKGKKGD
jgi:hypothetical protein